MENDPSLIESLMPQLYPARPEQAILIIVEAWDINCSQHIPRKVDAEAAATKLARLEAQVAALSAENDRLREALAGRQA